MKGATSVAPFWLVEFELNEENYAPIPKAKTH
jgi:hypothetical protein